MKPRVAVLYTQTVTTGAMKNAFGGLLNKHRHYTHTWIHETLVDLLAMQKEIHPGVFAVMDGTTAGDGAGPRMVQPLVKNVILASADQVAIDAIAAKMNWEKTNPALLLQRRVCISELGAVDLHQPRGSCFSGKIIARL